jgi:tyrosyl-tRNA synthetase
MDKQEIIEDLLTRGIENIIPGSEKLRQLLASGKVLNVYLGLDPTAPRIHLGHAFNIRKLQQFVELGHNVTFLIGDFTTRVGDTSDKDTERPMLKVEEIESNLATYKQQAAKFIDFDRVQLRHNSEWLSKLDFGDVIQLAGNFSVNDFNSRELIRKRLDAGTRVALPEVLYPLMQGYDSYFMDIDVQVGATDQTFNMQAGRTLQKRLRDKESFVLASGFLTGTDGRKMSKSWGNAIWLEDSADEVFGKIMSISDDLIIEYFTFATSLPMSDIAEIKAQLESGEHPMEIKKRLARRVVQELNGEEFVQSAEDNFSSTVQDKSAGADAPVFESDSNINSEELIQFILSHSLVGSKTELRRINDQNGVYVDEKSANIFEIQTLESGSHQLRIGKRRYVKLEIN